VLLLAREDQQLPRRRDMLRESLFDHGLMSYYSPSWTFAIAMTRSKEFSTPARLL
jgi:hypothetical protein